MELWTVEWSGSQGFFHIDPLTKTIERNLATYIEGRSNDYQILGIVKSYEEAHQLATAIEKQGTRKAA